MFCRVVRFVFEVISNASKVLNAGIEPGLPNDLVGGGQGTAKKGAALPLLL
jgi:hypothetical protein